MRVNDESAAVAARRQAGRSEAFGAALQRAETRRTEAGRAETGRALRLAGERLAARRGAEARGQLAVPGGASSPGGSSPGGLAARRSEPSNDHATAAPDPGPGGASATGPGEAGGTRAAGETARAALALAVRALPPVIEAFGTSGRASLALDFGAALGVELCQAPGGVEVRLSVSAALRPAARVELASLCRALASRGLAVVRAEVGGGRPGRGRW